MCKDDLTTPVPSDAMTTTTGGFVVHRTRFGQRDVVEFAGGASQIPECEPDGETLDLGRKSVNQN
ncbi:hypothetical protein HL667_29765 [Bradyrhizobium sp. 83012]|uniref:Uncharacterized protein n=1 Tax=Bradyrhizobium aeschynomenes TaxID=2734909 RepID=A0ABX2CM01_9BRAD|nr:hypothetical protein [Bradyrhizobium aeschynomenes]NPU69226.1 hypothetical protein [Bradyrhizobium aeschynomenes]NPV20609.1 hypothetical protein [Bradyrhizobium aeschynomenes]